MSSEESICSPLLERIKKLKEKRQLCLLKSTGLLFNLQIPSEVESDQADGVSKEILQSSFSHSPLSKDSFNFTSSHSASPNIEGEGGVWNKKSEHEPDEISCLKLKEELDSSPLENGFEKKIQDVSSFPSEEPAPPKFSYLRKGQGTSKYKTKRLKGFRKGNVSNSDERGHSKSSHQDMIGPSTKKSTFERLESLVEHDSFCSTSPKVLELLQDDSDCSSPLLRKCPLPTLPITPILREEGSIKAEACENESNGKLLGNKSSLTSILRKSHPTLMSPSELKVHFLEHGVEVLEYEEGDPEVTANDSDLISVSDLENLALFNYNVNLIRKNESLNAPISLSQFYPSKYEPGSTCQSVVNQIGKSNQASKPQIDCVSSVNNNLSSGIGAEQTQRKLEPSVEHVRKTLIKNSPKETLEVESHKALLLSKVSDLSREINIFKKKNKALEELIAGFEKERQMLKQKQMENSPPPIKIEKAKPKRKTDPVSSQLVVSRKLQEVNEKLLKLEIENINLKRKLNGLEKREKMATKYMLSEPPSGEENLMQVTARNKRQGTKSIRGVIPERNFSDNTRENRPVMEADKIYPSAVLKDKGEDQIYTEKSVREIEKNTKGNQRYREHVKDLNHQRSTLPLENVHPNFSDMDANPLSEMRRDCEDLNDLPPTLERVLPLEKNQNALSTPNQDNHHQNLPAMGSAQLDGVTNHNLNTNAILNRSTQLNRSLLFEPNKASEGKDQIVDVYPQKIKVDIETKEDSFVSISHYPNGDKKTVFTDRVTIEYAKDKVIHTLFQADGREEIAFENGQKEIYFKDGSYRLIFPDTSTKSVDKDGTEVCVWKDGTIVERDKNGTKNVHFPNGQREVYEESCVRRIYPDGTTKILRPDGSQETRYPNGRVRFKDRGGKVFVSRVESL